MAKNTTPIFGSDARHSSDGTWTTSSPMGTTLTSAANDFDGTNANNAVVVTADSVNGGYLKALRFKAKGTNVASAARIFLNNGGSTATGANNALIDDIALPATTASATAQTGPTLTKPINLKLAPGERVVVGLATAVAAGWEVTPIYENF